MAWGIWAIITVALLIVETITVDFLFMMFSAGTLAALFVSLASPSALALQIVVFGIISTLGIAFVRPWARRHVNESSRGESNVYALAGRTGQALSDITANAGRVKIGGEVWSAKCAGEPIDEGSAVVIQSVEGARVVVTPVRNES